MVIKMRKFLPIIGLIFLLLCAAVESQARGAAACAGAGGSVATCTTPNNGDELDDSLAGSTAEGGDNVTWTTGSGSITLGYTLPGTPHADDCTTGLRAYAVYGTNNTSFAYWNRGSQISYEATTNIVFDIYIPDTVVIADYGTRDLVIWNNSTTPYAQIVGKIRIKNNGSGTPRQIQLFGADGTSNSSTAINISRNTLYRVTLHLDATAASSSINVKSGATWGTDLGTQTFTRSDTSGQYLHMGATTTAESEVIDAIYGYVYVNTP